MGGDGGRGDPAGFWAQRDAARAYTRFAEASEALFVAAGELAARRTMAPGERVAWSTVSRLLGEQAAAWAELVPESVLLAEDRQAVEGSEAVVASGPDGVRRALDAHLAEVRAAAERMAPLADATALRVAKRVLDELAEPVSATGPGSSG